MYRKRLKTVMFVFICLFMLSSISIFASVDEMESNDTRETANIIKIGDSVYGLSDSYGWSSGGDDYYKFVAPVSGTVKVTLWEDASAYKDTDAFMYIYDSNNNQISYAYDSTDTEKGYTTTFGVVCGKTYYLKVFGDHWGFYSDGVEYHFKTGYYIGKTNILKLIGKNNAFNVKWDKKTNADLYQIRYTKKSTYLDYSWTKASIITIDKKICSKTISKLANKTNYYVQVKVARTIEGITYYSDWSPRKSVKTK